VKKGLRQEAEPDSGGESAGGAKKPEKLHTPRLGRRDYLFREGKKRKRQEKNHSERDPSKKRTPP